jgi:hypothetical protein
MVFRGVDRAGEGEGGAEVCRRRRRSCTWRWGVEGGGCGQGRRTCSSRKQERLCNHHKGHGCCCCLFNPPLSSRLRLALPNSVHALNPYALPSPCPPPAPSHKHTHPLCCPLLPAPLQLSMYRQAAFCYEELLTMAPTQVRAAARNGWGKTSQADCRSGLLAVRLGGLERRTVRLGGKGTGQTCSKHCT